MLSGCLRAFPTLSPGNGGGLRLACISIRKTENGSLRPLATPVPHLKRNSIRQRLCAKRRNATSKEAKPRRAGFSTPRRRDAEEQGKQQISLLLRAFSDFALEGAATRAHERPGLQPCQTPWCKIRFCHEHTRVDRKGSGRDAGAIAA